MSDKEPASGAEVTVICLFVLPLSVLLTCFQAVVVADLWNWHLAAAIGFPVTWRMALAGLLISFFFRRVSAKASPVGKLLEGMGIQLGFTLLVWGIGVLAR